MDTGFPGEIGKALVILGGVLVVVGLFFMLSSSFSWFRLGHLPGDIRYKGKHTTFYFPLTSCIILSAVASLVMWLFSRFTRR